MQTGMIAEARLKELAPTMPVIFIKAIPVDRQVRIEIVMIFCKQFEKKTMTVRLVLWLLLLLFFSCFFFLKIVCFLM
jgi:hypothetical protein